MIKKAFTLAEILITLAILGVITAITIPSIIRNNQTIINKTKIKKAFANYEKLMNQVMIENDLSSNERIDNFASNNDCINTRQYFKTAKDGDTNCRFMTSDKLWWDITDLRSTTVAFKEDNLTDGSAENLNSNKAFKFISGFEDSIFKINSLNYIGSKFNKVATKNLIEYIIGKVNDSDIERYMTTPCQQSQKNGKSLLFSENEITSRKGCYFMTSNETGNHFFIFDDNGTYKESYIQCANTNYSSCKYHFFWTKLNDGNFVGSRYNTYDNTLLTTSFYNPDLYYTETKELKIRCNPDGTNCQECYNTSTKKYEDCKN